MGHYFNQINLYFDLCRYPPISSDFEFSKSFVLELDWAITSLSVRQRILFLPPGLYASAVAVMSQYMSKF